LRQIFGDWPWATPQDFEQSALCVLSSEHVQYIVKHEYARNQAKESLPKATIKMMAVFFTFVNMAPNSLKYIVITSEHGFGLSKLLKQPLLPSGFLEAPAVSWFVADAKTDRARSMRI